MAGRKDRMRMETQRHQAEARGRSVHPRELARSVSKGINRSAHQYEGQIKSFREMTMKLPKTGKARIHPALARKCHKIGT